VFVVVVAVVAVATAHAVWSLIGRRARLDVVLASGYVVELCEMIVMVVLTMVTTKTVGLPVLGCLFSFWADRGRSLLHQ